MDKFEDYLAAERTSVERFVRFRLHSQADADDVLQEVYLTAYQKFSHSKTGKPLRRGSSASLGTSAPISSAGRRRSTQFRSTS